MPDELLQRFTKSYAPGAVICREGEEGEEMYIIQKGKVRVSKRFADKVHVVSILEKGDFFGETAIVNRTRRTATVTAVDAVELLVFDREGLQNMITRNARIALSIIDKLCRRLQNAHLQIQHLVRRDARGQIALHLRYVFQDLPVRRRCRSKAPLMTPPWRSKCQWTRSAGCSRACREKASWGSRETLFLFWTRRSCFDSRNQSVGTQVKRRPVERAYWFRDATSFVSTLRLQSNASSAGSISSGNHAASTTSSSGANFASAATSHTKNKLRTNLA